MISQNFPFLQPPQLMYPSAFDLFNYNLFPYGIQEALYSSQLYKRQNPYASYELKLPANHSEKKLKTQVGPASIQINSNFGKKSQKVINLEDDGDDQDLIIIEDENDNSALCVKDDLFKQIPPEVMNFDFLSQNKTQDHLRALGSLSTRGGSAQQGLSESGYFKSQYPNSQFLLNPSGANFNSLGKTFSSVQKPLVIEVDDDDECSNSNMSFDFGKESNLAVSIQISNNDYMFANNPSSQKKSSLPKIEAGSSPDLAKKGVYSNQIKIKNINISYFRPLSQLDKDTSTNGCSAPSEQDLLLADSQGAINFEDSETQSEIFVGPSDEPPTASIPALCLNRAQKPRARRSPKLVWDPKDIDRGVLEQFYSDLTKVTRKEITNEEVAINSLKMNGMDTTKTLSVVKHNRAVYRDLFTPKPHFNTLKK